MPQNTVHGSSSSVEIILARGDPPSTAHQALLSGMRDDVKFHTIRTGREIILVIELGAIANISKSRTTMSISDAAVDFQFRIESPIWERDRSMVHAGRGCRVE